MTKAYPVYKESDVQWVGEIPDNWDIKPMFTIAKESRISNQGLIENNLLSLSYGRIIRKDIDTLGGLLPESFETYQVVNKDDVIFRLTDLQNDKRSLRTAISTEKGIITSAYVAVTSSSVNPYFYNYLMRAYDQTKVFYNLGSGMRQSLKYAELKRLPIITPSRGEQERIVIFLDRETARIDQLIAEKQNFIKLLKEKRQTLISHVVTKGLDPNALMKDSGIEWIGEVPEHWVRTRLKFLVSKIIDTEHKTIPFVDFSDYLVVRTSDIREGRLLPEQCKRTDADSFSEWTKRGRSEPGDIIFTREAPAGEACIVPERLEVCLGQRAVLIKPSGKILAKYFLLVAYSDLSKEFIDNASMGSTVKHLNMADIPRIPIFLPNIQEQQKIVLFADSELSKIDQIRTETLKSIELLKEHRTALISAAVTGKIDVRNQA